MYLFFIIFFSFFLLFFNYFDFLETSLLQGDLLSTAELNYIVLHKKVIYDNPYPLSNPQNTPPRTF